MTSPDYADQPGFLHESTRHKIRPSNKSVGFTAVLSVVSVYVSVVVLGETALLFTFPLALGVVALVVFMRTRPLKRGLPEPVGRGLDWEIRSGQAMRQGVLVVLLGIAMLFVPIALLFYLPGWLVIGAVLGIVTGLSLSDSVFSVWIVRIERQTRSEIFSVTELVEEGGKQLLVKSVELIPRADDSD